MKQVTKLLLLLALLSGASSCREREIQHPYECDCPSGAYGDPKDDPEYYDDYGR